MRIHLSAFASGWAIAAAALLPSAPAEAQNAAHGAQVFNRCSVCHANTAKPGGVGPTLYGVGDRKAASVPGYAYSAAMKRSGLTWDRATLDRYLLKPQATVPGTKMAYPGVPDAQDRRDLVAYLLTLKAR